MCVCVIQVQGGKAHSLTGVCGIPVKKVVPSIPVERQRYI